MCFKSVIEDYGIFGKNCLFMTL